MAGRAQTRVKRRINCEFFVGDQKYSGIVIDVAAGGLFVRTTAPVKPGTVLDLYLSESVAAPAMKLRAKVARRRTVPPMLSAAVPAGLGLQVLDAPVEFGLLVDKKPLSAPIRLEGEGSAPRAARGSTEPPAAETEPQTAGSGEEGSAAPERPAPPSAERRPSRSRAAAPARKRGKSTASVARPQRARTAPAPAEKIHPAEEPEAVLIGGSELDEIVTVLDHLEVESVRCAADVTKFRGLTPRRLMIVSAAAAISLEISINRESVVGIAVADAVSDRLRTLLQKLGFQFMVRRPVDPEALRLLLHYVLYQERERRQSRRHPLGCAVSWRAGWRRYEGLLLEVSMGGCRLVSAEKISRGSKLALKVPEEIAGGQILKLQGTVIRSSPHVWVDGSRSHAAAVAWNHLSTKTHQQLLEFYDRWSKELPQAVGGVSVPPELSRDAPLPRAAPGVDEAASLDEVEATSKDRRRVPRAALEKEIVEVDDRMCATRVLFCRDLSVWGVRVEPHPGLKEGDRLRLALHDENCSEPLIVDARVMRDDGSRGWGLEFESPSSAVTERIQRLVASLPPVEDLAGDAESHGAVLTEVLSKDSEG